MKKRNRNLIAASVIILFAAGIAIFSLWGGFLAPEAQAQAFTPHYLTYQGAETRIYALSETSSYACVNQTYVTADSVTVPKDSGLFTINLILRNDYSTDNPPPNRGTPAAPIDGTAYIQVQPVLFDHENDAIETVNISAYDFRSGASGQTGLVLASGQTAQVQLVLVTLDNSVASFTVNLASINDSI